MRKTSISVILPTYRRREPLWEALESLQQQEARDIEVLVVDNAADGAVEREIRRRGDSIRYVAEPDLGLHNARHAGTRAARGEVLVFTDDDATFDPGWLQAYREAFDAHPEMVAAGGPIRPVWTAPPPGWLLRFIGEGPSFWPLSLMDLHDEFRLLDDGGFFGTNMAIRRNALIELGGFNPEAFGDAWLGDGEAGLVRKLKAAGRPIGYVPGAIVHHHIPADRMTPSYLFQRMAKEGACTEYARYHHGVPGPIGLAGRLAWICISIVRSAALAPLNGGTFASLRTRMAFSYGMARMRYVCRLLVDGEFRGFVTRKEWLEGAHG